MFTKCRVCDRRLKPTHFLNIAHIKVGVDGKKGWYLNLNNSEGEYEKALNIIQEYQQ